MNFKRYIPSLQWLPTYSKDLKSLTNIGIQLFSLPKLLDKDFLTAIKLLQKMGYTEYFAKVELIIH